MHLYCNPFMYGWTTSCELWGVPYFFAISKLFIKWIKWFNRKLNIGSNKLMPQMIWTLLSGTHYYYLIIIVTTISTLLGTTMIASWNLIRRLLVLKFPPVKFAMSGICFPCTLHLITPQKTNINNPHFLDRSRDDLY